MTTGYPSIDKPWLKYYSPEALTTEPAQADVYRAIHDNNAAYANDIALIYFAKKVTYAKLFREVERAAAALASRGVRCGENVALCMPAVPEAIYLVLAANRIGANAVMLNPTFTPEQMVARLGETGAKLLFVLSELWGSIEEAVPATSVEEVVACSAMNSLGTLAAIARGKPLPKGATPWNVFARSGGRIAPEEPPYNPARPAVMVYSSGTTGASKGIQLTNGGINATIADGCYIGFDWNRQDRYFAQIPIWFSTGICATVLVPLFHGITVILVPQYDFDLFYKLITKHKPNFMISATATLEYLAVKHPRSDAYADFKYLVAGGEYVTPHAEDNINSWLEANGCDYALYKGYGMCECGGTVAASSYSVNRPGSAGIPLPHVVVAAFDLASGEELPYGERGELRVLTPSHMLGYYKNPEATAAYFHEDIEGRVWCCTGDMGWLGEDGSVYVCGRLSDSYIDETGEAVYLFDVERKALASSQVRQCKAVVSIVEGIETHVCHLVLEEGAEPRSVLKKITDFCAHELPPNHLTRLFKLHEDALPVAPSGKIDVAAMTTDVEGLIDICMDGDSR